MVFAGTFEHTIDAKNRLAIPSDFRALLRKEVRTERAQFRQNIGDGSDEPLAMYVALSDDRTLCLYSEAGFGKLAEQLDDRGLNDAELREYERFMFGLARRVELDKQGRVRLPDNLMKMSKLPSEVVLVGSRDRIEIRDRAPWNEFVEKKFAENQA